MDVAYVVCINSSSIVSVHCIEYNSVGRGRPNERGKRGK